MQTIKKIEGLVFSHTKAEQNKPHLFFTDCTANPRPFAKTMRQRGIVHSPNPAPGNKPVCAGHQYSLLAMSPQGERSKNGRWLISISMKRVSLNEKGNESGIQQVVELIKELGIDFGSATFPITRMSIKNLALKQAAERRR